MSTTSLIHHFVQTSLGRSSWLERTYQRWVLRRAITHVYPAFAQQYPDWVDYCFDDYFLNQRAFPLLAAHTTYKVMPAPFELVRLWAEQFSWSNLQTKERHVSQLMPVVADLLCRLNKELFS